MLFDQEQRAQLSKAELQKLDKEITDLEAQNKELYGQVVEMQQASLQYFNENDVGQAGEATGTGRSWIGWIASLVIASACALVCGLMARKKNRNVIGWGIFGFFIPIAALIAILVVRPVDLEPQPAALLRSRV